MSPATWWPCCDGAETSWQPEVVMPGVAESGRLPVVKVFTTRMSRPRALAWSRSGSLTACTGVTGRPRPADRSRSTATTPRRPSSRSIRPRPACSHQTRAPRQIATVDQRLEGLWPPSGFEQVRVSTFSRRSRASLRASSSSGSWLASSRRCVLVGEGFHFGHNREGTPDLLRELGVELASTWWWRPPTATDLVSARVRCARRWPRRPRRGPSAILGRPFILRGVVEHGDNRGEEFGFPTANLAVASDQALPAEGVYAGATTIDDVWWAAAISVGTRPQFYEDGKLLVEVHVVDYTGVLYGANSTWCFSRCCGPRRPLRVWRTWWLKLAATWSKRANYSPPRRRTNSKLLG